jgi:hypothetical protein
LLSHSGKKLSLIFVSAGNVLSCSRIDREPFSQNSWHAGSRLNQFCNFLEARSQQVWIREEACIDCWISIHVKSKLDPVGEKASGKRCAAMAGLIQEGGEMMGRISRPGPRMPLSFRRRNESNTAKLPLMAG